MKIEVGKTYRFIKVDGKPSTPMICRGIVGKETVALLSLCLPACNTAVFYDMKGNKVMEIRVNDDNIIVEPKRYPALEEYNPAPNLLAYVTKQKVGSIGVGNLRYFEEGKNPPELEKWVRVPKMDINQND